MTDAPERIWLLWRQRSPIRGRVQCSEEDHTEEGFPSYVRADLAPSPDVVRGLVEALQEIAKPQYGLQGIIEDGDSDEERARYFGAWCSRYQTKARAALAAYEKEVCHE